MGQAVGIVGVLVARQPAIHRLPEQRYQMMLHVPARSAVLEGVSSQAGHAQGVVKFADGQEADVGGDGGTTELQAHSAIEMHSELSVGIFTHGVPPMALRLGDVLPILPWGFYQIMGRLLIFLSESFRVS